MIKDTLDFLLASSYTLYHGEGKEENKATDAKANTGFV